MLSRLSFRLPLPPLVTSISQFFPSRLCLLPRVPRYFCLRSSSSRSYQLSSHIRQPNQSAGATLLEPAQALSLTAPSAVPLRIPLNCCCIRASHAHHSVPRPFLPPAFSVKIVVSPKEITMLLSNWFLNFTVPGNLELLVERHVKIVS